MEFTHGSLFGSLIVSTLGFAIFVYGKKQNRLPQVVAGLALLGFPFFVSSLPWMAGIAVGVLGGLVLAVRAGC